MALAHLDLQIQIRKELLLFPLFVLVLQQFKLMLLSRVINESNSKLCGEVAGRLRARLAILQPVG